jgi:hypothetical protein
MGLIFAGIAIGRPGSKTPGTSHRRRSSLDPEPAAAAPGQAGSAQITVGGRQPDPCLHA